MRAAVVAAMAAILLATSPVRAAEQGNGVPVLPVPGMVTMVDLGAGACIPCKMMAPVLEEVRQEYEGRAVVAFIDVWKDPGQTGRFGIRVIPTQIFYDAEGRAVLRHEGFMDKDSIAKVFQRLGVQ